MKRFRPAFALLLLGALLFQACSPGASSVEKIPAAEAARRVAAGTAVLVDVREPAEWAASGVAAPAVLLAMSDFAGPRSGDWLAFLEQNRDRQILVYCRSGRRSGLVGAQLAKEGFTVFNVGGLRDWQGAGLPLRPHPPPE